MPYTCDRCGDAYEVGVDGDAFTSISVSYHDDERDDFAASFCQDCGDDLLAEVVDVVRSAEVEA
jgi:hypothetical protein